MPWKVFAASAIGKNHIDTGIPCQDDFSYHLVGDVFVGVVCDGAGSASHSEIGAKACSRSVVDTITAKLEKGETDSVLGVCERDFMVFAVEAARAKLQSVADESGCDFKDLSCTLVGCVASPKGGCLFHIGDGFAVADFDEGESVVSLPENGEYANETYFVTAAEWQSKLRVTPLPTAQAGCVALMSDGAAPFVINKGRTGMYKPFIEPVLRYLSSATQDEGDSGLKDTLSDERTYTITGDDKTLMVALLQ